MKLRILSLLLLLLLFVACPPPDYPVLFGYNGEWHESLKIEEGTIEAKITGKISFYGWQDILHIEIAFKGLDMSTITFFDSTSGSGHTMNTAHFLDNRVIFNSEKFRVIYSNIYNVGDRIEVVIGSVFDNHIDFQHMTRDEFYTYLDMLNGRIQIESIFAEPKLIEVKVNKKLLAKKLRGWVPALEENG